MIGGLGRAEVIEDCECFPCTICEHYAADLTDALLVLSFSRKYTKSTVDSRPITRNSYSKGLELELWSK